jgi:hypothetical protein
MMQETPLRRGFAFLDWGGTEPCRCYWDFCNNGSDGFAYEVSQGQVGLSAAGSPTITGTLISAAACYRWVADS